MTKGVAERANEGKLNNIETVLRDFVHEGFGLEDKSVDYECSLTLFMPKNQKNFLKKLIVF